MGDSCLLILNRFLWVNLQLENLCKESVARKDRLVEAALGSLPKDLNGTYIRIMERIECQTEHMKELALNCFMWVIYAKTPLDLRELQHALATNSSCKRREDLDVDEKSVILEACGNLLVEENYAIRPIHYSVQEFFTNPSSGLPRCPIQEKVSHSNSVHATLSGICLQYLQLGALHKQCRDGDELISRMDENPFILYAARCFDYHILQGRDLPEDVSKSLESLLSQDASFLAALLQARNVLRWYVIEREEFDPISFEVTTSTVIYGTQLYNIPALRTRWTSLSAPKYALYYASSAGLFDAASLLIEQGCDINERDGLGNCPLHGACGRGHLAVVELLLSKGADVNAQSTAFGTALYAAAKQGYDKIVELLLNSGAHVNTQLENFGSALEAASAGGHYKIVELLLSNGAEVRGSFGADSLQLASRGGYDKVVELLLSNGATMDAKGGFWGNALMSASAEGHYKIVELLLSNGADVNAEGGHFGNALQSASWRGHDEVVELLLNNGADVNAEGGYYGNALKAAEAGGHDKIVELLLSDGTTWLTDADSDAD